MDWIDEFLEERKNKFLLRDLKSVEWDGSGRLNIDGQEFIDFSSNDYLGLRGHPYLLKKAEEMTRRYGMGSSASRLMSGDLKIHHQLEEVVASFKGKESAIVFGSGYLANIGVIPAICGRGDVIFSDRANHASIIDGIILSKARLLRFRHNDSNHLEDLLKKRNFRRGLIVIESIYSMDGDRPPLKEVVKLKEKYGVMLMVDEAHATGIFGKNGGGVIEEEDLIDGVDIIMGTFSKALGSYGAYVACSKKMATYLINTARTFIYSTALPPPVIGANLAAIELIKNEPHRRKILLENVEYLRNLLKEKKVPCGGSSQIVPVIIGENERTVKVAQTLQKEGIFALPIRPPTVPKGEARIRFSLTYYHSRKILNRVAEILEGCLS